MKRIIWGFCLLIAACSPAVEENYYIPENYEGPITVVFLDSLTSVGMNEYHIPENGIIITPYKLPKRKSEMHFYYTDKSKPIKFSQNPRDVFEGIQVSCYETGVSRSDNSRSNVYYVQFIVADHENRDKYYAGIQKFNIGNFVDSVLHK